MIKILITDKLAKEGIDILKNIDGVEPVVRTGVSEDQLSEIIGEYDGLIIRSDTKVTPKVLARPGKLRAIARAGVGVDNINVPEATRKGIIVMNTPGGNTLSAAEHTMALMLAMSRNVVAACNSLKTGAWDRKQYTGNQLNNKVLGIIGLGRIGMAVAKIAVGFNMHVIGFDPFAVPKEAEKLGIEIADSLERVYKESDFITIHVPKNEQTLNMITAKEIALMKPSVRLINCARGGIINENDLYDALQARKIEGAALDVFSKEPPDNMRFMELSNCLVTPHLGASTQEAQVEVAVEAAQIIVDAIKGGPVRNAVNAPWTGGAVPPIVRQYAELAQRIGTVISSIAAGHIKSIHLEYRGALAEKSVEMVTTAFSIGLLQPHFDMPVNMVNVGLLAKERGISIDETKNTDLKDLVSSFTARVITDKVTRTIVGAVFGEKLLRIIGIDGFDVEMTPRGTMMVIYNADKPGVIGSVGTVCGRHGINISTMGVGQKPNEGRAILAVSLDKQPDEATVKELSELDFVSELYICRLDIPFRVVNSRE